MKQNIWLARIGIAAWPAFIGAGLFTVLIFFRVAASDLIIITGSRFDEQGFYSITFIMLWLFGTTCGAISSWLGFTSSTPTTHQDRRHPGSKTDSQ